MRRLSPNLDVLPAAQRRLWEELRVVPDEFTLYGGTAIALQLGHRTALYFDFFGRHDMDVIALERGLPFLAGAQVVQREARRLTAIVDRGGPVKVTFAGVSRLPRFAPPLVSEDNGLKVASLVDLAGIKALVVQVRGAAEDYIDMDALLRAGGVSLPSALAAARKLYGRSFSPEKTLKALSYPDDGGLRDLPPGLKLRLAGAVRDVDLDRLPRLVRYGDRGHGLGS